MLGTLNVSLTGLNAAKIAVENVSNNIANENTPGYKKRVVQLDELAQMDSRFTGRGVNASSTYRITSQYMYDKLMAENTKTNYYEKLSNMLGNVESLFAETEDSGLSSDINRYFQAIENLRSNPNSEVYRSTLKTQASLLVDSIKNIYTSIEKQQVNERDEFSVNVDKVNGILKEIGSINEKIASYNGVNNDLLDKRDVLESELSNYVNISVDRRDGFYELKISGQTVISNSTNVRQLNIIEEDTPQVDKFNHIKYNSDNTFQIYDSMKYEKVDDNTYTPRNFYENDVITYKLNNEFEVSVKIGEVIPDITKEKDPLTNDYPPLDINGDGSFEVTEDELVRALVYKINTNSDIKESITAYNGDYVVDENGNKITDDKQDNFLRIESVLDGLKSNFDGHIYIEEQQKYSTYSPEEGDVVAFRNVQTDSELYQTLQDETKFKSNGDGTYTVKANVGEIKILEDESIQKKFVGGEIVISSTLNTDSEFSKALQDPTKFTPNINGTYTATNSAGTITLEHGESVDIFSPESYLISSGTLIDRSNSLVYFGSQLETDLSNTSKFTNLGNGIYKSLGDQTLTLEYVNQSFKILEQKNLDIGIEAIPQNSVIKVDNLIGGSKLQSLLSDSSKFTYNVSDNSYIVSSSSISQSDFVLTGNESLSVTLANNSEIKIQGVSGSLTVEKKVITTGMNFDEDMSTGKILKNPVERNEEESRDAESTLAIGVFGNEINLRSGILKAQIENLSSTSETNKYQEYLNKLDSLAKTLSDISDKYIKNPDGSYVYGEIASEKVDGNANSMGLFSGSSVKTLKFNEEAIRNLNQEKLDYLSTIQWKDNLSFGSLRDEDSQGTSLNEFYRDLKVNVALDNENVDFLEETQTNVKLSIQNSYDQLTKVDKDEEMLNLIKFQAAYTANAKIITAIDEMLNTLLGLKR